jgi:amino acid transporter
MTTMTAEHRKVLGRFDMVLFTVSAILLLETLAAAASTGTSAVFWWLFLGLIFLLPFAMICAEMGCSYPEQGGIYAWIRDAFGGQWGSRATWCYWINTAVWIPAIYILFAGIFKQLFFPNMGLLGQIAIGVTLTWITVLINVVTLDVGKWVPNIGALLKVLIFIAVIYGAVVFVGQNGMANPISLENLKPEWGSSLQFVPAIIYGMLGFELVSAGSDEMTDPARDVPKAVLMSGIIILLLYVCGTTAVLAALPLENIDLVEGLVDTLRLLFGGSAIGDVFVIGLGIAALYSFFSNGVTWALGCNRTAAQTAEDGELPRFLGIESRSKGTPVGAAVSMGVASTLILVLYGLLAGSNEDLFWSLFAFSAVIFLLPYLGMLLAFIRLRLRDVDRHRPYQVPGGQWVALGLAALCFVVLAMSIVLFIYTPDEGMQWPVFWGAAVMLAIGEVMIRASEARRQR